jgi:hypothetical protein
MAAQEGIRDKILRVLMPFEKRRTSGNKTTEEITLIPQLPGTLSDPWSVVLKVPSWAGQLSEGKVGSRAEIARREGITRARISQL